MTAKVAYSRIKDWFITNLPDLRLRISPEQISLVEDLPDSCSAFTGDMLAVFREVLQGSLGFAYNCADSEFTIGDYAKAGAGSITGKSGCVDFTNDEADEFHQGPLADHISGVTPSFAYRPERVGVEGKYMIMNGDGSLVDDTNRDSNTTMNIVTDFWLGHYQSHKRDWWEICPEGPTFGLGECQIVMLRTLQENNIDWRAELSPDEVKKAEVALVDALRWYPTMNSTELTAYRLRLQAATRAAEVEEIVKEILDYAPFPDCLVPVFTGVCKRVCYVNSRCIASVIASTQSAELYRIFQQSLDRVDRIALFGAGFRDPDIDEEMAAIAFTGACICDSTIELLYRCEVVDAMAAHGDAKALEILKAIDFTLAPKISEYPKDDLPALLEKQEEDPRKMTSGDLSQWNDAMFKLFPAMRFLERVRKAANTIEERLAKMQSQQ